MRNAQCIGVRLRMERSEGVHAFTADIRSTPGQLAVKTRTSSLHKKSCAERCPAQPIMLSENTFVTFLSSVLLSSFHDDLRGLVALAADVEARSQFTFDANALQVEELNLGILIDSYVSHTRS